jgi:hypothetical protein
MKLAVNWQISILVELASSRLLLTPAPLMFHSLQIHAIHSKIKQLKLQRAMCSGFDDHEICLVQLIPLHNI